MRAGFFLRLVRNANSFVPWRVTAARLPVSSPSRIDAVSVAVIRMATASSAAQVKTTKAIPLVDGFYV